MSRNKYGNRKVEADGFVFDSQAEYRRFLVLRQRLDDGEIVGLMCQPVYVLQAAFRRDGKHIAAITYVGDFQYVETATGKTCCEDVKGVRTAVFNVKWKLAMARYPNVDFRIVQM